MKKDLIALTILSPGATDHLTPEYLKLNPNEVVPTLINDGYSISDSSVIIEYIDEVFGEDKLTPNGANESERMSKSKML